MILTNHTDVFTGERRQERRQFEYPRNWGPCEHMLTTTEMCKRAAESYICNLSGYAVQ